MSAANHPVSVPISGRANTANLTLPAPVRVMSGSISITGGGGTTNATLAGLTDVHFAITPTAGQALVFDGVNSRWTNGRPAWTLPDWTSTHIYEPGDTVYHQGQFWRNIQTAGANSGHEPKLLKAEAIGWFRRGGHTLGPLYPEFVEIGDTFLAPTGTIATHFGAHYAVKYHSDTNWTVWEWKVISHGPPIVFGWHKIDVAHKVTHRHYAEPSPVTAEETGLLWIFDEPGSTSTPVVPQRYWEPVVLGDYLVSLADVDASKAVAGDTLVLDANGRWVATPLGTTPGGGGLDIDTANGLYVPLLKTANTPLSTVTNLQRSFGVIGASNSGAIGLSNTTAQIRLVNKSNTDERLVATCLTLSGVTDTVTGTNNLSVSSAITSTSKTTRVNEGSLAKTTELISTAGVTLTLKASSTPNASNGTGDASYTVIGGAVEFVSNSGNGFRYSADHGLTEIAGNTNSTIVDDSYIVRRYADTRYLKAPAAATANQVLTYNGTAWGAANATTGNLSLYVPKTSNAPLVIETTEQASSAVGITIISKYNQYSSNLTIDGSAGFSLQDMRGSTVKSSTQGEVLIIPDTILSPSPTKIRVLVGQVDIPVGPQGANSPTGGITIQQDGSLKALVAPDTSTFADPLSYVTSGHADATYLRISASTTLPYLTQDVADARYPTLDGSATGKYAAYTDNAPGYTGQYVLPDGKVMIIQNGVIVSIS